MAYQLADQASCLWAGLLFVSSVCSFRTTVKGTSILTQSAMFVALGMAEIVSAVPTSGGPYFWAAILAPKGSAAFWSWITGW